MPLKKRALPAAAAPQAAVAEQPKRSRRKPAAAAQEAPAAAAEIDVATGPADEAKVRDLLPEEQGELALSQPVGASLPAIDAPAINSNEPECSYKIDFSNKHSWFASTDGGATKTECGYGTVAGFPVDFALQINKAKGRNGFDQRFRLAFIEPDGADGCLVELNINAINTSQQGDLYVTSSGRSLAGALLAISESEDDMAAFCNGARFRLRPGTGKGVFIETDIAVGERWIGMASPANTNRIAKDAHGFHAQLELIKSRFRGCGLLLSSAAVVGQIEDYDAEERDHQLVEIPVVSTEVMAQLASADS